jgi:hypothetical protein
MPIVKIEYFWETIHRINFPNTHKMKMLHCEICETIFPNISLSESTNFPSNCILGTDRTDALW